MISPKIITNNPLVYETYNIQYDMDYIKDGLYLDVLIKVRDFVHKNYEILTHPLSGSVKPGETPYKSVIVKETDNFNEASERIIADAILKASHMIKDAQKKDLEKRILNDFMLIDKSLLDSGIESMNQFK